MLIIESILIGIAIVGAIGIGCAILFSPFGPVILVISAVIYLLTKVLH